MTAAAAPTNLSPTTDDDALAYFEGSFGCSYDDDDAFFLDHEACVTGDLYTCNHYLLENSATDDGGALHLPTITHIINIHHCSFSLLNEPFEL